MESARHRLSELVNIESPQDVFDEVKRTVLMMFPRFDFEPLNLLFRDILDLFQGRYPGYQKCDTTYHELQHTTDTFLTTSRIIHGATIRNLNFSERGVVLTLISALLHDSGYILARGEKGPGAKYTLVHIGRSIAFMEKYFMDKGYSREDMEYCDAILKCTGLDVNLAEISFVSQEHETLGKMLGTADLSGQMADRTYLEKLPFLYYEFKEANVEGLGSELDFLRSTPVFVDMAMERFRHELGGVYKYMRDHFRVRWGIDEDLYTSAIETNIRYLKYILEHHEEDYHEYLSRGYVRPKLKKL
jgi:hypothetical protein